MNLKQTAYNKIEETLDIKQIDPRITERDRKIFAAVSATQLTDEQQEWICSPDKTFPRQEDVLAVHWHPETIPFHLIEKRFETLFPNARRSLIIPTQHNQIKTFGDFCGVEVDCYSPQFKRKVQLLLHFSRDKLSDCDQLNRMLAHTFQYRSSQLLDFISTIVDEEHEDKLEEAAAVTGAGEQLVEFVRIYTRKIRSMIDENIHDIQPDMLKNKLLRNYFDLLRGDYPDALIDRVKVFLKAVKKIVKRGFNYEFFYRTEEIIEEARAIGAGVVVPHPEQFWPILLAEYDVDGYEVWNPQSQEYTEFLIHVVRQKNEGQNRGGRRLLVFMGDDCHLGEKIKPVRSRDRVKAAREVGVQPAWEDPVIRKALISAGFSRGNVIEEYIQRLT